MKQKNIYGTNVAVVGRLTDENPVVVIDYLSRDHNVFLVNKKRKGQVINGRTVFEKLTDITQKLDTAIFYMRPELVLNNRIYADMHNDMQNIMLAVLPPGADSREPRGNELIGLLKEKGIEIREECPRVRLSLLHSRK